MLALQPFLGTLVVTPKDPHEGPLAMLVGPVLLGVLGIAAARVGAIAASNHLGKGCKA